MARPRRVDFDGAIHHVMNRGVDRQPVFFGDADRVRFGRLLADIHERDGVATLAYCLMGNHYHLLLRSPGDRISTAMQWLGGRYTQATNDRCDRDGPIFRGRFSSKLVTTDPYLLWVTRYIHRNPLDIAGVRRPSDYCWSSYRAYLGHRAPASFLDLDAVLSLFDNDRDAIRRFTETDAHAIDADSDAIVDDLVQLIELALASSERDPDSNRTTAGSLVRTVLMMLGDDSRFGALRSRIDAHLGFPSAESRRKALARARARAESDSTIRELLATVRSNIARTSGV